MRNLDHLNNFRVDHPLCKGLRGNCFNGAFRINGLNIIASNGNGWDHVSVSKQNKRLPFWNEMCWVKENFFEPHETVIQFHPREDKKINFYEVLHLWRKQDYEYELPQDIMV